MAAEAGLRGDTESLAFALTHTPWHSEVVCLWLISGFNVISPCPSPALPSYSSSSSRTPFFHSTFHIFLPPLPLTSCQMTVLLQLTLLTLVVQLVAPSVNLEASTQQVLMRRKREWIWNSLYVEEEKPAPIPYKIGQVSFLSLRVLFRIFPEVLESHLLTFSFSSIAS